VQSAIQIKSGKSTILAFNVQIKNVLHYRNRVWYGQFIQYSSNAVIFVVNYLLNGQ